MTVQLTPKQFEALQRNQQQQGAPEPLELPTVATVKLTRARRGVSRPRTPKGPVEWQRGYAGSYNHQWQPVKRGEGYLSACGVQKWKPGWCLAPREGQEECGNCKIAIEKGVTYDG